MHLRCDGPLGFPGGIIESNEDVLTGVTREVQEEIGFDVQLSEKDFVARILQPYHRQKGDKTWDTLNSYFFAKEITEEEFKAMEINHVPSTGEVLLKQRGALAFPFRHSR